MPLRLVYAYENLYLMMEGADTFLPHYKEIEKRRNLDDLKYLKGRGKKS